ncbi:MAG: hypothetical protein AVDCRST_MAG23-115, partial [uncultured Sphingosinicella sp.]
WRPLQPAWPPTQTRSACSANLSPNQSHKSGPAVSAPAPTCN